MRCFLLIALLGLAPLSHGQAWTGILVPVDSSFPGSTTSASRYGINWANNGVGGIPPRTTIFSTVNAASSPCNSGAADCTATIQAQLNACPSGQAVLLSAGTFLINSHVTVPSNCTLRGAGASQTILNGRGSGSGVVIEGGGAVSYSPLTISAGATAGSTTLTLSATTGVTVGGYLVISELNNSTFVTVAGTEGTCTWCDGWGLGGTRARGEIHEVEGIMGNVVTIFPPVTSAYTNTPTAAPFSASAKMAGLENLQIYANNTGYTNQVYLSECAYCWVTGVEYNYSDGNPIEVDWGYRDEIDNSYVSNAFTHVPGSTDSAIFIVLKTSWSLIQNNILERQHVGIILEWGACCNVVAYNYSQGNFDNSQSPGNCNPGTGQCVLLSAFLHHGAHPQFNLWEGNVGEQLYLDSVWGSSSHDTSFRGWYKGTSRICTPYLFGTSGRTAVTNPCYYAFQAARGTQISQISRYDNFVGDLWGSTEQSGIGGAVATLVWPSSRAYDGTVYNATFGYGESADSGSPGSGDNSVPFTSALIHGVYTNATSTFTWSGALTRTFPASFYLPSKPAWWGSAVPYPATGPDVSGGSGPGGFSYGNPAMHCYLVTMGGTDGGVGSPLTFNPSTCYSGAAPPPAVKRLLHTTQSS